MGERVRVLHVVWEMRRAGAEMRTLELFSYADRSRFHLDVCSLSGRDAELDDDVRRLGCEVYRVRRDCRFSRRFAELLCKGRYDVVHSQVNLSSGFVLRIARKCGVPIRIAHLRNSRLTRRHGPIAALYGELMRIWIRRCATHVVSVSEGAMETAWEPRWREDPHCRVVYDGLDVAPYEAPRDRAGVRGEFGWHEGCRVLVHVGRAHPQKNHPRLIRIFRAVAEMRQEARLLLVGDLSGPLGTRAKRAITALGLEDKVVCAGVRGDVPRLLLGSDMLLFPSRWEGLPGAVLEACAAGLPVLASDTPGIPEIARRFRGVRMLSLSEPDETWAKAADEILSAGPPSGREWTDWNATPFSIGAHVAAMQEIWAGAETAE